MCKFGFRHKSVEFCYNVFFCHMSQISGYEHDEIGFKNMLIGRDIEVIIIMNIILLNNYYWRVHIFANKCTLFKLQTSRKTYSLFCGANAFRVWREYRVFANLGQTVSLMYQQQQLHNYINTKNILCIAIKIVCRDASFDNIDWW